MSYKDILSDLDKEELELMKITLNNTIKNQNISDKDCEYKTKKANLKKV